MITTQVVEGVVNAFLKKDFDGAAETPEFHREMWEMCCSTRKFVAIAAPRGFAKSTAITLAYVLTNIIFRERQFILIISDTESQAVMFLGDIKKQFLFNEDLIKTFSIKGLVKDQETDIIIEFMDGHQVRLIAKGSGQSILGMKWNNKRPDLIIGDDLENQEMVMTKENRAKFRTWFSGTLLPCRSKEGIIRLVGTIRHTDSLLNRYMPRRGRRDQPIYEDDLKELSHPNQLWLSARYRAHDKMLSKSLWPQYKPVEWLRAERQTFIDAGQLDNWAQEMLNVPFDESNAPFQRRDFATMLPEDTKQNFNFYISTDFATQEKQKSDYTVFLVAGISPSGVIHIVQVVQQRMDSPEIVDVWFELVSRYDPISIFVEKGQIWNMLRPLIFNEMARRDEWVSIEEMATSQEKRSRTAPIRARMRAGSVKFNKEAEWYPDFEEECLRFTGSSSGHDDQVDALSLLGLALNKFVEAPSPEEEQEDEYEEEYRASGLAEEGRSLITGY